MSQFYEALQSRIVFSGSISTVTADYNAVVADAAALKSDLAATVATYKSDAKVVAADIRALGKNKINSAYVGLLNKAVAASGGADRKYSAKLVAVGKTSLARAKAAFLSDVKNPTASHAVNLSKQLALLATVLIPFESVLATAAAAGDSVIDARLNALATANPSDASLASAISTAEAAQTSALTAISGEVATINADIYALVTAIT